MATFSIAVNRPKRQDREQEADFINIVVWGKQAENCNKYIKKGSQIAIDGRIQTRSYDGEDGRKRYVVGVVAENVQFLDTKKENAQNCENTVQNSDDTVKKEVTNPFAEMGKQVEAELQYDSDDLPF